MVSTTLVVLARESWCVRVFWHQLGAKIESTVTRGLGIASTPTSDNLTPQETTNQDTPDMETDGAGLSCPGSSVVADEDDGLTAR